jgi:hypothetical protein
VIPIELLPAPAAPAPMVTVFAPVVKNTFCNIKPPAPPPPPSPVAPDPPPPQQSKVTNPSAFTVNVPDELKV